MATAACLPIAADRVGACVRTIYFEGLDLTDVPLAMEVRLNPETPGPASIALGMGATANAEGLRLAGVTVTNGTLISQVVLRINETTMEDAAKVPYSGELGSASVLYYDLIGIFGQDKRRLAYGTLSALPTVYGMDAAPANRQPGTGYTTDASATWTSARLIFSDDQVTVKIDGADLVGLIAARAEDAAALAEAAGAALTDSYLDILYARAARRRRTETIEQGTRIPDLVLTSGQLPEETVLALLRARAASSRRIETIEPGTRIPDLVLSPGQIAGRAVGAGGLNADAMRDVRHTHPAAFAGTFRQKTLDGKQQIVAVLPDGTQPRVSDGTANDWLEGVRGSAIALTSDRSDGSEAAIERPYTLSFDGRTLIRQSVSRRAVIFVYMGESLVDGSPEGEAQNAPVIPLPKADGLGTVMMMNGGVRLDQPDAPTTAVRDDQLVGLAPLFEAGKQTAASALGRRLWNGYGIHSVHINVAVSGQKYAAIKPGTVPYSNGIRALSAAIRHLRAHGYEPEVALVLEEAVNDSGSGPDYTWVWANLRELQAAFTADVRAALGDTAAAVGVFAFAPNSVGGSATGSWVAGGVATYRAPGFNYCGSLTGIEYVDTHHQTGLGAARIGDVVLWPAVETVIAKGQAWTPFRPVAGSAVRSGASLSFQLEGFVGKPVYVADEWAPALSNWGIRVFTSAGNEVTVNGVVLDGAKVTLALAADPGANAIVTGALGVFGDGAAPINKARTNIADQSPLFSSLNGRPFPRRLGQFRITSN